MSLAVRVIPCLDVDAGRVVKGVHFENLKDAGDPVELAAEYYRQGADEITFLDVTASSSHRNTMIDVVSRTAEQVFIPMTVGRRRTHARGRRLTAALRCRQGRCQHGGHQRPVAYQPCGRSFRQPGAGALRGCPPRKG